MLSSGFTSENFSFTEFCEDTILVIDFFDLSTVYSIESPIFSIFSVYSEILFSKEFTVFSLNWFASFLLN